MIKSSKLFKGSLAPVYPQTQQTLLILQDILTSTLSLLLRSHEAHWNVKGMTFGLLHELFGGFYDFLDSSADTVAERIVQLDGTVRSNPQGSSLSGDDLVMLTSIREGAQKLAEKLNRATGAIGSGDEVTGDILTEFQRELEKWLWKIESHLK